MGLLRNLACSSFFNWLRLCSWPRHRGCLWRSCWRRLGRRRCRRRNSHRGGTLWGQENLALALAILMQLELVLSRLVLLEECVRPLLVNALSLSVAWATRRLSHSLWLPQVLSRLIAHAGEQEHCHTCWLGTWLCTGSGRTHANASTCHRTVPTQWCPKGFEWALLVPFPISR